MKKLLGKHSRLWSLLSEKMNKSYSESLAFINIYLWHNIFFHKRETVSPNIFNRQVNMKITQSCPTLRHSPWNSPGQNTGVGSLSLPSPGHPPNPGIKPRSPTLQADSLPAEPPGKPFDRQM